MTLIFRVLDQVSPALGGRLALRLFVIPPKHKRPDREKSILSKADIRTMPFNGMELKVYRWGSGPLIVLSHGWAGRATQFYAVIEHLVDSGFRVAGVDLPGHGDSSGSQTNMLEASKIIYCLISDELSEEESLYGLIGHSFGSGVALVSMNWKQINPKKVVLISGFKDIDWVLRKFGEIFSLSPRLIQAMKVEGQRKFAKAFDFDWSWEDLSPEHILKHVQSHTLLVHDKEDHEVPFEHSSALHRVKPESEVFHTTGFGHRRLLRQQECVQRIGSHLKS